MNSPLRATTLQKLAATRLRERSTKPSVGANDPSAPPRRPYDVETVDRSAVVQRIPFARPRTGPPDTFELPCTD